MVIFIYISSSTPNLPFSSFRAPGVFIVLFQNSLLQAFLLFKVRVHLPFSKEAPSNRGDIFSLSGWAVFISILFILLIIFFIIRNVV